MKTNEMQYDGYTAHVSIEPEYYGTDCTAEDAVRICDSIKKMIESEFPGIRVREHRDGSEPGKTTGPVQDTVDSIDRWIESNWTKAL